jgi:hypothetical protein
MITRYRVRSTPPDSNITNVEFFSKFHHIQDAYIKAHLIGAVDNVKIEQYRLGEWNDITDTISYTI